MRVEKRGTQNLYQGKHPGTRKWENHPSFVDSLKENYEAFISRCLELRQQLQRHDEPPVRIKNPWDLCLLSLAWHEPRAASGWYLQRTGEGPVGCQGNVAVSFITHKVLCSWKKSQIAAASQAQLQDQPALPFLPQPPPQVQTTGKSPAVFQEGGAREAVGPMGKLVETACRDSHSLSVYLTPTMF